MIDVEEVIEELRELKDYLWNLPGGHQLYCDSTIPNAIKLLENKT